MTAIEYRPDGATLEAFFSSDEFVRTLIGPFGSGKTSACCNELFRRIVEQAPHAGVRRSSWVAVRNTFRQLSMTTVPSWRGWYGDRFGAFSWSEPYMHRLRFPLPDGTRVEGDVQFLALDGADAEAKLRGLEVTGAWLNECRELDKGVVDFILGRVGRYPALRDGGPSWSGVIADTNSFDSDHWLYRLAEEVRPAGWRVLKQPGGVIREGGSWVENPAAENRAHLPPGYYMRQIAGQSDDWVRLYLGNEYAFVADGRPVFPEYRDAVHCAPEAFPPLPGLKLVIGVDFGLTPAAVLGQRTPRGQWRICDELVAEDMGVSRFGELLAARLDQWYPGLDVEVWGDPAGGSRAPTDERTVLDVLRAELGVPVRAAPTNDVAARLEAVRAPLNRMVDGLPGFYLSPACKRLRKALAGGYAYRRIKVGGERYEDKPDKNEHSHVADGCQYMLAGGGEYRRLLRPQHGQRRHQTFGAYDELRA